MKITCISDTHTKSIAKIPDSDVLVFAGDFSIRGYEQDFMDFILKLEKIENVKEKVIIAGNHDFCMERQIKTEDAIRMINNPHIHYLNETGVKIDGYNFWGSPWTPWFHDWAFNMAPGTERLRWNKIPDDTDVLITHGPPFGILDRTNSGKNVGCLDLLDRIKTIKPKCHIFGHIHEAYGITHLEGVTYVNACQLNLAYDYVNKPITIIV